MLVFKGIQKTTLIDFPGEVACTVFLPKCNFRCPYCYNRALVFDEDTGVSITESQLFGFLDERKGFLDAVCITGGEPTLHAGLPDFCGKLKEKGFLVKVDTNGTNPEMTRQLLEKKLVDYVAMDIKAPLEKYGAVANAKVNKDAIRKSAELIKGSGIRYEFRTTVLPEFLGKDDLLAIGQWLKGAEAYFLQQFFPKGDLIDKSLEKAECYSNEDLGSFAEMLAPFFGRVEVRSV